MRRKTAGLFGKGRFRFRVDLAALPVHLRPVFQQVFSDRLDEIERAKGSVSRADIAAAAGAATCAVMRRSQTNDQPPTP
jgi:hypothetical protein